ncbi:hypothetical protein AAG570_004009 [Ranatra chinensis]|uniref:Solute carrier family 25 member 46 n=1 Tax=Ranatra chinensis TaxID=642074 RepID=A0ABD0YKN5_9HEMI
MENLLSHPFVVLRRQCQVNHKSKKYHIVPITLIPVIIHLHQRQGITTLWKGIGSTLLVRGMTLAIEDIISKITPWPKEIQWHKHSLKEISQHIILKCVTLAIVTPFYSASLVETVQSDIASEKPGIFDVFKEGLCRLISWSSPQKGRMLPIWAIVVPNVTHGLLKYYFSLIIKTVTVGMLHIHHKKNEIKLQGVFPKDWSNHSTVHDIEASAQLISLVAADAFFFPLETILHRLQLQGTRTLIDNMDSGQDVVAILTSYEGANDCYLTSLDQEGSGGLYKGFGALVLQFTVHFAVIKLARYLLTQAVVYFRQIPPPAESQPPRNLSQERLPQWSMNR